MDKQTLDKFKYLVNKRKSIAEICTILSKQVYEIYEMVAYLKMMGQDYDIVGSKIIKVNKISKGDFHSFPFLDNTKICLMSDPHYGSNQDRPDIMQQIYSECSEREISSIFCAGDLTNGYYPRRKSYNNNKVIGYNEMLDYVVSTHPYSKYINFYTIGGNHDASFTKATGLEILADIAKLRSDIIYLGQDIADITLGTLKMRIYHGYGKKTKSSEDRIINCYNKMHFEEGSEPDILQLGHLHFSLYMPVGKTHVFQTGAIIDQLSYAACNRFPFERSCWFLMLEYDDDGNLAKVLPEYKSFGPKRARRR